MPDQLDDTTRTYTAWDDQGHITLQRPYTPEENAQLDARIANQQQVNARESDRASVRDIVVALKAEQDRCDAVIAKTNAQITPADTKDVARAAKRIADAAIALARFVRDL